MRDTIKLIFVALATLLAVGWLGYRIGGVEKRVSALEMPLARGFMGPSGSFIPQGGGGGAAVTAGTGLVKTGDVISRAGAKTDFFLREDCVGMPSAATASHSYLSFLSGGTIGFTSIAGHPGVCDLRTGATATGRAGIASINNSAAWMVFDASMSTAYVEADVAPGPALCDATQDCDIFVGFGDSVSARPTDGVFFQKLDTDASWQCVSCQAGTCTTTDSTVDAIASTYDRLRVEVDGACSATRFFVDDVAVCVGHATTNCPTGTANATATVVSIIKSAGTTERTVAVDYIEVGVNFTAAR